MFDSRPFPPVCCASCALLSPKKTLMKSAGSLETGAYTYTLFCCLQSRRDGLARGVFSWKYKCKWSELFSPCCTFVADWQSITTHYKAAHPVQKPLNHHTMFKATLLDWLVQTLLHTKQNHRMASSSSFDTQQEEFVLTALRPWRSRCHFWRVQKPHSSKYHTKDFKSVKWAYFLP